MKAILFLVALIGMVSVTAQANPAQANWPCEKDMETQMEKRFADEGWHLMRVLPLTHDDARKIIELPGLSDDERKVALRYVGLRGHEFYLITGADPEAYGAVFEKLFILKSSHCVTKHEFDVYSE